MLAFVSLMHAVFLDDHHHVVCVRRGEAFKLVLSLLGPHYQYVCIYIHYAMGVYRIFKSGKKYTWDIFFTK